MTNNETGYVFFNIVFTQYPCIISPTFIHSGFQSKMVVPKVLKTCIGCPQTNDALVCWLVLLRKRIPDSVS